MTEDLTARQDVSEVTDTLLNYCQFLDEKRLDDFVMLFKTDCIFEEGRTYNGRDAVKSVVSKLLGKFERLSHHLSNIRVTKTSQDTAKAMSYIYAWHQLVDGQQLEIWGRYVDELHRDEDQWRIAHRVVQIQGFRGLDELKIMRVPLAESSSQ